MIDEFRRRGLFADATEHAAAALKAGQVTGYIGFDPTAASLHVGSPSAAVTARISLHTSPSPISPWRRQGERSHARTGWVHRATVPAPCR